MATGNGVASKFLRKDRRLPRNSSDSRIDSTNSDYSNDCEAFIDSGRSGKRILKEEDHLTSKQLRNLQFSNPGKFMEDFDPERSSREMRKVHRRIYTERSRRKALYDENGLLISNQKDVCDCLIKDCVGCHYPCPKCGSEKCGAECRCNRTWCYGEIEVEGTSLKFTSEIK